MTRPVQLDLFANIEPPKPSKPAPGTYVDPDEVRADVYPVLARLRAATTMPLNRKEEQYWRAVFPNTVNWLPREEADRLRAEFAAEMRRLDEA